MKLTKKTKKYFKIGLIIILIFFLLPERVTYSYENKYPKKRVRYNFPDSFIARLLGLKSRTIILVDSIVGQPDKTIHIFNYRNDKAYQFVLSPYGNSYSVRPLDSVQ